MDIKTQSTPTLPLELVERIVDLAGHASAKACMLVSRQFHAGAVRNIYRSQTINLKARSDVLSQTHSRLFGAQDQSLIGSSRGRHVRELHVYIGHWPRYWGKQVPEYEGNIILQLLKAISKLAGLQKLWVHGGGFEYKWGSLPLQVREGLQIVIKSPSLFHLSLQEVHDFPADILLHGNKALRTVCLTRCGNVVNKSEYAVILPEATKLHSDGLTPVNNGLLLPRLQKLTAYHWTTDQRQDSWLRIDCARKTLRWINILDTDNADEDAVMMPILPINLKMNDFPELSYLSYSYEGRSWTGAGGSPLLSEVVPFFETAVPAHKFTFLTLNLHLDQWDGQLGEEFWSRRKDCIATDRSWATVDKILASERYPKLGKVLIFIKIFNSTFEELDWETIQDVYPHYTGEKKAIAEDIKGTVLGHFVKTKARGIGVVVDVCADF